MRSTQSFITQEGTTQTTLLGHTASASLEAGCRKQYWEPWIRPGRPCPPLGAHQLSRVLCHRRQSGYQEWFTLGESRLAFPRDIFHSTYERSICSLTFSGTIARLMGLQFPVFCSKDGGGSCTGFAAVSLMASQQDVFPGIWGRARESVNWWQQPKERKNSEAAGYCSCDCCSSAFNVLKLKGDRIFWQLQRGPAPWATEQYMLTSLQLWLKFLEIKLDSSRMKQVRMDFFF